MLDYIRSFVKRGKSQNSLDIEPKAFLLWEKKSGWIRNEN